MSTKTKYAIMEHSSVVTDDNGNYYPDIATFNINYFKPTTKPISYKLNESNVYRFDLLTYSYYGAYDFYDDITLWLSNIPYLTEDYVNTAIKMYSKADLDSYYSNY